MKARIPVTIVTGFLGSGKTTLLSNLLRHAQARRLAILVNEFGEVSIDGTLLRSAGAPPSVEVHDLPHGLIAYSEDDQFLPTMAALRERRNGIDHVLIETSGLALPTAVMAALQQPALAGDFTLDAALTVVDTPLLRSGSLTAQTAIGGDAASANAGLAVAELFQRQLEFADIVVLNKIDGLDDDALLQAEALVRRLAPGVRFLELAHNARLDAQLVLGLRLHEASEPAAHAHHCPVRTSQDGHAHSGLAAHAHGLSTHKHFHEQDPGWQSFVLRCVEFQQAEPLCAALSEIAQAEPILRLKGFAAVAGEERRLLVQGVRSRVTMHWAQETSGARSEIVFIGYHPSRERIVQWLSETTGTCWK